MKKILYTILVVLTFILVGCETSDDISNGLDHQVPDCKTVTISANSQTKAIDDTKLPLLLWGVVPQTNLELISLPTITVEKGATFSISAVISDNVALKTAELSYGAWLFAKYINFANPEGDIPKTPQSYTLTAQVTVPDDAISTPWLEDYYFNDGSSMKITQSYHKFTLTIMDVNMNKRIIPIFVKVE